MSRPQASLAGEHLSKEALAVTQTAFVGREWNHSISFQPRLEE